MFDHWHCSLAGPTFPNREYLHAGTSVGRVANVLTPGQFGLTERTVFDQLNDEHIPWKQNFTDLPFGALYLGLALTHLANFQAVSQFYADAAAGTLPPVCFVEPGLIIGTDDHPPASMQAGQRFLADVVTSAMHSPQWPETAIFVTYDEHGGFFDHVAPPNMPDDYPELGNPIGVRVPTRIVSPWAPKGRGASSIHDHTSITKFIQWRFLTGSPSLTKRNAAALNPVYAFDFSKLRTDVPGVGVRRTLLPRPHPAGQDLQPSRRRGPRRPGALGQQRWRGAGPEQSRCRRERRAADDCRRRDPHRDRARRQTAAGRAARAARARESGRHSGGAQSAADANQEDTDPFLDRRTLPKTPAWKTRR